MLLLVYLGIVIPDLDMLLFITSVFDQRSPFPPLVEADQDMIWYGAFRIFLQQANSSLQ